MHLSDNPKNRFRNGMKFLKPCEKPIIEFTRLSCQQSAFNLNIKYFYHKQLIIKHKLIIKSNFLKNSLMIIR